MVTTYKNADEGTFYESPILQTRAELSLDSWDLDMMGESGTFLWCQFRRPVRCHLQMEKMQDADCSTEMLLRESERKLPTNPTNCDVFTNRLIYIVSSNKKNKQ